ncbi:hypothetical protein COV17_00525 [Candidatus Woesearchaeota archaeon CG10_big_fil_rev_8_21_14_0_10_36_11]|nr:MAG: hypothetical protein COV17_00525 [Candidatus Woesearchaeota archaeon CG10_big_fil_rev_8_21_14_0_10_36_11]
MTMKKMMGILVLLVFLLDSMVIAEEVVDDQPCTSFMEKVWCFLWGNPDNRAGMSWFDRSDAVVGSSSVLLEYDEGLGTQTDPYIVDVRMGYSNQVQLKKVYGWYQLRDVETGERIGKKFASGKYDVGGVYIYDYDDTNTKVYPLIDGKETVQKYVFDIEQSGQGEYVTYIQGEVPEYKYKSYFPPDSEEGDEGVAPFTPHESQTAVPREEPIAPVVEKTPELEVVSEEEPVLEIEIVEEPSSQVTESTPPILPQLPERIKDDGGDVWVRMSSSITEDRYMLVNPIDQDSYLIGRVEGGTIMRISEQHGTGWDDINLVNQLVTLHPNSVDELARLSPTYSPPVASVAEPFPSVGQAAGSDNHPIVKIANVIVDVGTILVGPGGVKATILSIDGAGVIYIDGDTEIRQSQRRDYTVDSSPQPTAPAPAVAPPAPGAATDTSPQTLTDTSDGEWVKQEDGRYKRTREGGRYIIAEYDPSKKVLVQVEDQEGQIPVIQRGEIRVTSGIGAPADDAGSDSGEPASVLPSESFCTEAYGMSCAEYQAKSQKELKQKHESQALKLGQTKEQIQSRGFFQFPSMRYLGSKMITWMDYKTWMQDVDRFFAANYLGLDYWSSGLCESFGYDVDEPAGVSLIETQSGTFQVVAHIEAEKSVAGAMPCDEDAKCPAELECKKDGLCYEEGKETPKESYFYKISWGVTAPRDEEWTAQIDEDKQPVMFNIQLKGMKDVWIFASNNTGIADENSIGLDNGERSSQYYPELIVDYSIYNFDEICVIWGDNKPKTLANSMWGGGGGADSLKEIGNRCNTIVTAKAISIDKVKGTSSVHDDESGSYCGLNGC